MEETREDICDYGSGTGWAPAEALSAYQGDEWAAPTLTIVSGMLYCRVKSAAEGRSADKSVSGDRFYRTGWKAVCEEPVPVQFGR